MTTQVPANMISSLPTVQTADLADASVTTVKIADSNVTTAKLAASAVTPAKLSQPFSQGTVAASTSGTSITFSSIPSWVKRITVLFNGVSLSGTAMPRVRIGPAGGLATSGYSGASTVSSAGTATANFSAGFDLYTSAPSAANVFSGTLVLNLMDSTNNIWVGQGQFGYTNAGAVIFLAGGVTLSGVLTQLAITTTNGTDTFDAGSVNILYE